MNHKRLLVFVALCLFVAGSSFGAVVGKISGVITDAQTKEPLVGVSVSVVGTTMGAVTDANGVYNIVNVPVGAYTLKFSSVGFASLEVTNVEVSADLTAYQNRALTSQATELGRTITVKAERPLILKDKTSNIAIIRRDEIQALPTRGFEQVVGMQNGVVKMNSNPVVRVRGGRESLNSSELNVRGGRPSEVAYYVDGFSTQDPLSGNSTANISNNAIQEVTVMSGGFPAEYGNVASGIVNTITNSGSQAYHGTLELVSDNVGSWMGDKIGYRSYDNNYYSGDVGGPIPGTDKATFFFSGERRWLTDRSPSSVTSTSLPDGRDALPGNWRSGWSYQSKVKIDFTPTLKLELGGSGSNDDWSEYRHDYLFDIKHTPFYNDKNLSLNAKITHTLNAKTFYNLSGSYFKTYRFRGDGQYRDDIWGYARTEGNKRYSTRGLFWYGDVDSTPTVTDTQTVDGEVRTFVTGGDEGSVWDDYYKRKSSYIGFKGDINSELDENNTVKAGFEFQRHTMRYYRHLFPTNVWNGTTVTSGTAGNGFIDVDRYGYDIYGNEADPADDFNGTKHPINGAMFVQDRLEWRGMIVSAGLRFDYFDYNTKRLRNVELPLDPDSTQFKSDTASNTTTLEASDLEPSKKFTRLSPRLGMAFPISDRTQMYVNFGKFYQRPDLIRLYVGYDFLEYKVQSGGYYYAIGNPNLEPEKTTQYEIGFSHQLGENTSIEISTFYKDIVGLVQVYNQATRPNSFNLFRNSDYGNVRGLESHLHVRRTRNIELDVKYTFSYAVGTGSYSQTQQNLSWTGRPIPKQISPLDYDQRHNLVAIFDYRTGKGEGPRVGDVFPLENFGINIVSQLASGTPYSPAEVYNEVTLNAVTATPSASRNTGYGPFTWVIDLKAERAFALGNYKITPYIWIKNLFDRDNATSVYESTGRPNTTGYLLTESGQTSVAGGTTPDGTGLTYEQQYNVKQNNPQNYSNPRMVLFGVRMSF
jgi:outer membrane receptor protein involved in Fe transport